MKDENGRKGTEFCGVLFLFLWYCFTYYLKKLHRKNTYTFLQARSNLKNDHMKTAASVCCQPLTEEKEQKKCPAAHAGTTFLKTDTNTFAKHNFRQIHNPFIHTQRNNPPSTKYLHIKVRLQGRKL